MARIVHRELLLKAPPDMVYRLISDPEHMRRWYCDWAEPISGGIHIMWNRPDGNQEHSYIVTMEAIPGQRFSYHSAREHTVTTEYVLEPNAMGTRLTLTERGFDFGPEGTSLYEEHETGWDKVLGRLQELAQ